MKLAVPVIPPTLDEALAFVDQLRHRPDASDGPPLAAPQWEQAVTAAVSKRDRDGLATLLRVQLVPALGRAVLGLARVLEETVEAARASGEGTSEPSVELVQLIESVQRDVVRAGYAVWAAELRSGLLPDRAGPAFDRPDGIERVQARMVEYLQMRLDEEDVLEAIADDLRLALRELTGPARAAVEVVDVGKLDDLLEHPLQLQLFATFRALSSAHLYLATISKAEEVIERARGRASG